MPPRRTTTPKKTVTQERDELKRQLNGLVGDIQDLISNGYAEISELEEVLESAGVEVVKLYDLTITVTEFQSKKDLEDGSSTWGKDDNRKMVSAIEDAVEKALKPLSDCGTVSNVEVTEASVG